MAHPFEANDVSGDGSKIEIIMSEDPRQLCVKSFNSAGVSIAEVNLSPADSRSMAEFISGENHGVVYWERFEVREEDGSFTVFDNETSSVCDFSIPRRSLADALCEARNNDYVANS